MAEAITQNGYELPENKLLMPNPIRLEQTDQWSDRLAFAAFKQIMPIVREISSIKLIDPVDGTEKPVGLATANHMIQVGRIAYEYAEDVFRGEHESVLEWAFVCGVAHDVGKLEVGRQYPEALDFSRQYSDEDRRRMGFHSKLGASMLLETEEDSLILPAMIAELHHHSKVGNTASVQLGNRHKMQMEQLSKLNGRLTEENLRQLIVAVSAADTFEAVCTREYVPEDVKPNGTDHRDWSEWFQKHLDTSWLELPAWQRARSISAIRRLGTGMLTL